MPKRSNGIADAQTWRSAARAARAARAEPLRLPSGATILAAKPEPLEWIMSGRIPQRLLAAALASGRSPLAQAETEISREEILDLARFATQLVKASVVEPAIGDGPGEISLDDIPIEDRAFIFEWASRALSPSAGGPAAESSSRPRACTAQADPSPTQEDLSSDKLERFRAK